MPAASSVRHCPDCGVTVRPIAQQCWLCSRVLVVSAPPVRHVPEGQAAAAPNPFAENSAATPQYYYTTNPWGALAHLLAILAILPATAAAFMTTCTIHLVADPALLRGESTSEGFFWLTCCGSAVIVFVIFCMLIVSLGKKTVHRVEIKWTGFLRVLVTSWLPSSAPTPLTQVTLLELIFAFFGGGMICKFNVDGGRIVNGRCSEDLVS